MAKHEYEVYITYTEDDETAKELALDMYSDGKTEIHYSRTEARVEWSDEED